MLDSRIVITCADAAEAERAKVDAISFGIQASTAGDQLILSYGNPPTNKVRPSTCVYFHARIRQTNRLLLTGL